MVKINTDRMVTIPLEEYEKIKKKILNLELKVVYLDNIVGTDNINIMFGGHYFIYGCCPAGVTEGVF